MSHSASSLTNLVSTTMRYAVNSSKPTVHRTSLKTKAMVNIVSGSEKPHLNSKACVPPHSAK